MSKRRDFEEFCRRTRPPMNTDRNLWIHGKGDYTNIETRGAWRAWQYLDKQYNPRPKGCTAVNQTIDGVPREPFAWYTEDYLTDKSATTYDLATMERWKAKGWPVKPLYTEQPAPVAAVLPPKRETQPFRTIDRGSDNYTAGWNAYANELKRLNPSL